MLLFVVLLAVLLGATVFSAITFILARGFVEVVVVGRAVIAVTLVTLRLLLEVSEASSKIFLHNAILKDKAGGEEVRWLKRISN